MFLRKTIFSLLFSTIAIAKVAVYVPTGLPTYGFVEKLEAYGCAKPTLRVLAPLSHPELQSALISDEKAECQAPEWLLLEREVLKFPIQPGEVKVRLVTEYDRVPLLGQDASAHVPFNQLEGRTSFSGQQIYGEVFLGSQGGQDFGFAASITPGFVGALDDTSHLQGRFYLHEGYLKVGYHQVELLYGRLHPEFGYTQHGSLFLSHDSKPQNMIKFSVRPHLLGTPFYLLGPFSFETWISGLGDASTRADSKLWASAIAFRPWTFLELGWLHAVQFGGAGAPSLEFNDVLKTFFYSRAPALDQKRRESTAFHFGIWGPKKIAKVYTQLFFNQPGAVSGWLADDMALLAGLWFPKMGEAELRLEYVHVPPAIYAHSVWRQGWSTDGTSLGHGIGSDGEALYLDLGLPPISTWRPTLSFAYEARNRSELTGLAMESRFGGGVKALKRWDKMELGAELKYQSITNFHYSLGENRNAIDLYTELRYFLL